jgi:hypothetical protein
MAQQTAVEWLVEKLRFPTNIRFTDDEIFSYKKFIEHAKEMEKEQIEAAYNKSKVHAWGDKPGGKLFSLEGEEYYNETYTKKQQNENKKIPPPPPPPPSRLLKEGKEPPKPKTYGK